MTDAGTRSPPPGYVVFGADNPSISLDVRAKFTGELDRYPTLRPERPWAINHLNAEAPFRCLRGTLARSATRVRSSDRMTEDPSRFELFAFWRTSATYRVRVALGLKGIAVTERLVNLDAGEQRRDEFLTVNPMGAIPALLDREAGGGGTMLTQSLAILEFLDEVHPEPPLLPADPHGRARVRSIALMLAADTHPLIVPRVRNRLTSANGFGDAEWRAWQTHWFTIGLQAVERRLATDGQGGTFCHGDRVTTADICLASILVVMRVFGIVVADIPTIDQIMSACEQHEAFARADPRRQDGAPNGT